MIDSVDVMTDIFVRTDQMYSTDMMIDDGPYARWDVSILNQKLMDKNIDIKEWEKTKNMPFKRSTTIYCHQHCCLMNSEV